VLGKRSLHREFSLTDQPERSLMPNSVPLNTVCKHAHDSWELVYTLFMARTNIDIDESLVRKARKLTRLKTKRQIVDRALELLVRSESRKGILRYYGSGVWKGDVRASRRNRA
jgi:Arc/MetJ family transcription regulator